MSEEWQEINDSLKKVFVFKDFLSAMRWMQKAAPEIEKMNHHPEWSNVYNRITVVLRTHDAGNTVTDKDRRLAALLDGISAD